MMFLLLAAAAAAPSAPTPLSPLGAMITAADYPAAAMRSGVTGQVGFRLRVDATGKPDGCVVTRTSGSAELDNATCDLMLTRARFSPARGVGGEPERGDFSSSVAWTLDERPEQVVSEAVRVRSVLDARGAVTSCTATPAEFAAGIGGCGLFGNPRMLAHLVNKPLAGYAWIEMRLIKQASPGAVLPDPVPDGAVRVVLARATVAVAPDGTISGCTNDVVTRFDGRALDLCAIGQADPKASFAPAATAEPRRVTIVMETVSQAR